MENNTQIKKIKTAANIGLIGSLIIVVIVILFKYLSNYAFYQNGQVFQTLTLTASVLVVIDLVVVMSGIRKKTPQLRQGETLEKKLEGYAALVKSSNTLTTVTVVLVSGIIILTGNYNLLMLAMLLVLILFFTYPNMYKIKVDLGLNDDEMKLLFGDQYIPTPEEPETEIQDPLEKKDED